VKLGSLLFFLKLKSLYAKIKVVHHLKNRIEITRTNSENLEFKKLVQLLNSDLARRDGNTHSLSQFNSINDLKHVVLALKNGKSIGCGAISMHNSNTMEIKRMYVSSEVRGQRIGEKILCELEDWSRELKFTKCILFTGSKQPEASKLYQRNGYNPMEKYGKLKDIPDSLCFAKNL
jgi:putative acetyltransferase